MKLRTLIGFLSPSLDRPTITIRKNPASINFMHSLVSFLPGLSLACHRFDDTVSIVDLWHVKTYKYQVFFSFMWACICWLQIATSTEARTNISRMAKPRACFWMQAAASWQPQVRFSTGGLQIPATATLPILKSGTLDPLSMHRTMPDLSRENIGYSWSRKSKHTHFGISSQYGSQ